MAVKKKGSRPISVEDHVFRWRVSQNDGYVVLVLWPEENEAVKVLGWMDYHSEWIELGDGRMQWASQAVITNRIVKAVILKLGVDHLLTANGQIDIGDLANYYDMNKVVRSGV